MIWGVDPEGVIWEDGHAKPASSNVGDFPPMSLKEIAGKAALTGGPISAASVNAGGQAPGFSTQFCDVEVDPETGKVTILRFVAAQDVGQAIHPSYVEGQIQGGVVQGIGWALNEEYIYDQQGRLDNPGFLDYRCPVASDLPMIETIWSRCRTRPSLRRQGRRRGQYLPADGGDRQRDRERDRPAADRTADVAAEGARRGRRARAKVEQGNRTGDARADWVDAQSAPGPCQGSKARPTEFRGRSSNLFGDAKPHDRRTNCFYSKTDEIDDVTSRARPHAVRSTARLLTGAGLSSLPLSWTTADLPTGARSGPPHHRSTANE